MARYLIEVSHEAEEIECARAVKILLSSGSHFLTNADWGCADGVHEAWIIVEADSKNEARYVLPPAVGEKSSILQLNKFTLQEMDEILKHHEKPHA